MFLGMLICYQTFFYSQDRKKIYGFKEQCKSVEDVPMSSSKTKGGFHC